MEFRTVLLLARTTATGIEVPPEVVEALGSGRKPAVTVTLDGGHSYPSTVASIGGRFLVLDTAPRVLAVPDDLAAALDAEPAARTAFDELSHSNRRRHTLAVEGAKAASTRARRVEQVVAKLLA